MKKTEAINTFNEGLVMDTNPLIASNKGLCNALNATFITMNGNENVLLNDMGNGRVETAYLPEGYIPVGTTEFGGIIYIVSYNPLIDKCLIGSFPSPERNIMEDELENQINDSLKTSDFIIEERDTSSIITEENAQLIVSEENTGLVTEGVLKCPIVKSTIVKKKITGMTIHPGDKFLVSSGNLKDNINCISNLNDERIFRNVDLKIATIDSNGRIVYLNDLLKHTILDSENKSNEYYIKEDIKKPDGTPDLDAYRKLIGSNYNIFSSKISGELYVVAELETIESFSVEWKIKNPSPTEANKGIKYVVDFTPKVIKKANDRDISHVKYKDDYYNWSTNKTISVKITNADANGSKTFEFTPCMNYGRLDYLKASVTIDFSLFGTDTVLSKDWRYFLEENQMIVSYSLESYLDPGKEIESVTLYFIPRDKVSAGLKDSIDWTNYFSRKIENRKSYSGNYLDKISFNDLFIKNELYLVVFVIKVSDNTSKFIYHCLYTNGVFNNEYINSELKSFDEININLLYDLKLKEDRNLSFNSNIITDPVFILDKEGTHIQGCTQINLGGNININSKVDLINNYNTFSVNQESVKITITKLDWNLSHSENLMNTGGYNVDPDYVNIKLLASPIDSQLLEDWITIENIENNIALKGSFYNKISANTVLKKARVLNYYRPLAMFDTDYLKYGIYFGDDTFNMSNSIIGLGMSTGGRDNQGGGGLMHVYGLTNLSTSGINLILTSTDVPPTFGGAGDYGISTFPNSNFSNYIEKYYGGNVFAPILLVNVGNDIIHYGSTDIQYSTIGNRKKHDNKRVTWFKEEQPSTFKVMWLFAKSNNNTQTLYLPFNLFYKFTDLKYSNNNDSFPEYIAALISQLYIKEYNSELSVDKYGVNNISYFNNITENVDILVTLNIQQSEAKSDPIKFNEIALSDIYSLFKPFFNELTFKCLTVKGLEYNLDYLYKLNISFVLDDLLLEKYLLHQSETLILDSLVENTIADKIILSPDDSSENLYQIDFATNKLVPVNNNFIAKKITKATNSDGKIQLTLSDTDNIFNKLNVKSIFTYDNRNKLLLFKESAYNSGQSIKARWEGHETTGESDFTYFKDIRLIQNKDLGSLNRQ